MVFTAADSAAFFIPAPSLLYSEVTMVVRPIPPQIAASTQYRKSLLEAFAAARLTESPTTPALNDEGYCKKARNNVANEEATFLKKVATLSSSPERLWAACAMAQRCSLRAIHERRRAYDAASIELDRVLSDRSLCGTIKHQFHCRHRLKYGRMPLVCRDCWSYLPICICPPRLSNHDEAGGNGSDDILQQIPNALPGDAIFARVPQLPLPNSSDEGPLMNFDFQRPLPPYNALDMVLWTHHKEWGSPSNTGSVLVVALEQLLRRSASEAPSVSGHMLMKGLEEHETALEEMLQPRMSQEVVLPVVLWASDHSSSSCNDSTTTSSRTYVSVEQLFYELRLFSKTNSNYVVTDEEKEIEKKELVPEVKSVRIVLIAVEGTWSQARRMVTKLPACVRALHLSDAELFGWRRAMSVEPFLQFSQNSDTIGAQNESFEGSTRLSVPVSILDPLRKQKTLNHFSEKNSEDPETESAAKLINTNKVCTMEAAVSALVALQAVHLEEAEYLISLADQKVLRTVAYQGKMALRNILSDW